MKESGRDNDITIKARSPSTKQGTLLRVPKMSTLQKEDMNTKSAMALYMGGLPFRTFHNPYMKRFLFGLSWESWSPPDLKEYSTTLLDSCYETVKKKVDGTLKAIS